MRAWLELIRLPAVFTAPADVLAGVALAGAAVATDAVRPFAVVLVVLASVAIYAAGMAANDLFDLEIDRHERPFRPLPSGRIAVSAAWRLVVGLQVGGVALAALASPAAAGATAATVLATYAYNAKLKSTPVGPLSMGLCRYGNALIGISAVAGGSVLTASSTVLLLPLGTLLYVAAVTGISRHEATGEVGPGLRASLVGLAVLSLHALFWLAVGLLSLPALSALAIPVFLLGPVRRAWQGGAGPVRGAVMAGIFGIALVNASVAAGTATPLGAGLAVAVVLCAALGRRVGRRMYST